MRLAVLLMVLAGLTGLTVLDTRSFSRANAEECTGENCPPKDGQGSRDHDCERKENTIS